MKQLYTIYLCFYLYINSKTRLIRFPTQEAVSNLFCGMILLWTPGSRGIKCKALSIFEKLDILKTYNVGCMTC